MPNRKPNAVLVALGAFSAATLLQTWLQAAPASAPGGTFTALYSFGGPDGAEPEGGLVQGPDGVFYGTTSRGGANDDGTVFRFTPGGALTTLYAFTGGTDGSSPIGRLVVGKDGALYGTTDGNNTTHQDTFFRITPSGRLTTLAAPSGPYPGPIVAFKRGADGDYHQVAYTDKKGTRVTMSGNYLALYRFAYGETSVIPRRGLFMSLLEPDKDGSRYDTDDRQSASSQGRLLQIAPDGTRTTVHTFTGPDGSVPSKELLWASDGSYYGTTHQGGAHGHGTLFRWTPPTVKAP